MKISSDSVRKWFLAACGGFLMIEGGLLLQEARKKVDTSGGAIEGAAKMVSTAAGHEDAYWLKEEPQLTKLLKDSTHLVGGLDVSFNGGLIRGGKQTGLMPQLTATVSTANDALHTFNTDTLPRAGRLFDSAGGSFDMVAGQVSETVRQLQPGILGFNKAAEAAAEAMGDPAIHQTFLRLAQTALNFQGMTDDGHHMTTDSAAWVHRNTAPVRGTYHTVQFLLEETWKARGAFGK